MSEAKLLTTSEVAEKLGVTRWRITQLIKAGRLKAEKFGQIYLIKEEDLTDDIMNRPTGRPTKAKAEN